MTISRQAVRLFALLLLAVLRAGVAANCGGQGGMYQGGRDSVPSWRR